MSDFFRVLGVDPFYASKSTYMWIDSRLICKVYPVYAVQADGQYWRVPADRNDADAVSYALIDVNGVEYSCSDPHELEKIGIDIVKPKGKIGFLRDKEEPSRVSAVDLG